ncbi:MAG: hypothetical protein H0V73_09025 [Chloroflexi bacterium]|nr:hypothetical protein [Chloroflexota bacterium]
MPDSLPPGLYESLVTLGLRDAIERLTSEGWTADIAAVDDVLVPELLADHLRAAARRSLASLTGEGTDRLAAQIDVVNRILETLRVAASTGAVTDRDSLPPAAPISESSGSQRHFPPSA